MRRGKVKTIISYYNGIPGMIGLLEQERRELEAGYNGLRSTAFDAAPHGSAPGKPVELLAEKLEMDGLWGRIQEKAVKIQVMRSDAAVIRDCLDTLNSKYKSIVYMREMDKYSWGKISAVTGVPDSTARRWYDKAVDRLGEALEDMPMKEEILGRASRARV